MLFEKLVDTPVRGVVYEAALAGGAAAIARDASRALADPARGPRARRGDARAAVDRLLGVMMSETHQTDRN